MKALRVIAFTGGCLASVYATRAERMNMNDKSNDDKLAYVAPELEELGSLEELTHGNTAGSVTDADFTAGTPAPDLTFS